ncbi:MAG: Peptidoglycan D,D-transpeptidase MrdA, partial [uncultured Thermoleophilia bacterium]
ADPLGRPPAPARTAAVAAADPPRGGARRRGRAALHRPLLPPLGPPGPVRRDVRGTGEREPRPLRHRPRAPREDPRPQGSTARGQPAGQRRDGRPGGHAGGRPGLRGDARPDRGLRAREAPERRQPEPRAGPPRPDPLADAEPPRAGPAQGRRPAPPPCLGGVRHPGRVPGGLRPAGARGRGRPRRPPRPPPPRSADRHAAVRVRPRHPAGRQPVAVRAGHAGRWRAAR